MPIEVHIQIDDLREGDTIATKYNYDDLSVGELNNMLAELERVKFRLLNEHDNFEEE